MFGALFLMVESVPGIIFARHLFFFLGGGAEDIEGGVLSSVLFFIFT